MIQFHYQTEFDIPEAKKYTEWIIRVAQAYNSVIDEISFIFVTDQALLELNKEYLSHNYYTDIITFPYQENDNLMADIFISVDRVRENADGLGKSFEEELKRVMIHGLLHMLGFGDKTLDEEIIMRQREDDALKMFHVEQ
jgi:probable rRNA maturation factor